MGRGRDGGGRGRGRKGVGERREVGQEGGQMMASMLRAVFCMLL